MASARGLTGEQVATLSKHRMECLFEACLKELFGPVLKVMAGFRLNDNWFMPRMEDALPFDTDHAVEIVFPQICRWREEQASPTGDKHQLAQNFLHETLPFLAIVILQDGPQWIKKFLDHIFS